MSIDVSTLPVPARDEPPPPDLSDFVEVERRDHLNRYGHGDLVTTAEQVAVSLRHQESTAKSYLLARAGGTTVGCAKVWLPLTDNTALGWFIVGVDPAADVAEVCRALWGRAQLVFEESGRTSVQCWQGHPVPPPESAAVTTWLTPATGTGRLAEDDLARWLQAGGFSLEQVELHSTLDVRSALTRAPTLVEQARSAGHAAYRTVSWVGTTPREWRAPMAALRARMSVDAPSGDLDQEEEVWDVDRIDRKEEQLTEMGMVMVTTIAVEALSGAAVAYTEISHEPTIATSAVQDDTLVHGDHRGHRLGLWVKAQNLLTLAQALPAVQRVHTWNAAENAHMLAINQAMGFAEVGAEGGWQWRTDAARP